MNDTRELKVTLTFSRTKPFNPEDSSILKALLPETSSSPISTGFLMVKGSSHILFTDGKKTIEISSKTQKSLIETLTSVLIAFDKQRNDLQYKHRFEQLTAFGLPILQEFAHVTLEEKVEIENFYAQKSQELFPFRDPELQKMADDFVDIKNDGKPIPEPLPPAPKSTKGLGLFDNFRRPKPDKGHIIQAGPVNSDERLMSGPLLLLRAGSSSDSE